MHYQFSVPSSWYRTREELAQEWVGKPVTGSAKHYYGKATVERYVWSYLKSFEFKVEFPQNYKLEGPVVLVLTDGQRNFKAEKKLLDKGAFKVIEQESGTCLQLRCKPPASGWYYFTWAPPASSSTKPADSPEPEPGEEN